MSNNKGFTLFEALIALAIGAVAMGMLFEAVGSGLEATRRSNRYEEAISRAKSHLAAVSRDASVLAGTKEGDDGNGFQWHLDVLPMLDPETQTTSGLSLYQVTVSISWREALNKRSVTLETLRLGTAPRP